uniref:Uncharacterized protein n=1 Tax=Trichuris muris TaxID=70415 RepID=A0A5S6QQ69_TRIMR
MSSNLAARTSSSAIPKRRCSRRQRRPRKNNPSAARNPKECIKAKIRKVGGIILPLPAAVARGRAGWRQTEATTTTTSRRNAGRQPRQCWSIAIDPNLKLRCFMIDDTKAPLIFKHAAANNGERGGSTEEGGESAREALHDSPRTAIRCSFGQPASISSRGDDGANRKRRHNGECITLYYSNGQLPTNTLLTVSVAFNAPTTSRTAGRWPRGPRKCCRLINGARGRRRPIAQRPHGLAAGDSTVA